MIPISFVTIEHAISNFGVDVPDFHADLKVACWNATNIAMRHIQRPDVEHIPDEWLFDEIPAGLPIDEAYIPKLPSDYSTNSPPVEKYVIIPGELQTFIMLAAGELFQNRESGTSEPLSPSIMALLDTLDPFTLQ